MTDNSSKGQDFLESAKSQFAHLSEGFQKSLEGVKDPVHRKQMAASYLDMLQKALARAQEGVAKYQERLASESEAEPEDTPPS